MAAVQYVQHPHYRALLLRKTYADLSLPDAIMDRAISWWDGVEGARFSYSDKTCYFPSGGPPTLPRRSSNVMLNRVEQGGIDNGQL